MERSLGALDEVVGRLGEVRREAAAATRTCAAGDPAAGDPAAGPDRSGADRSVPAYRCGPVPELATDWDRLRPPTFYLTRPWLTAMGDTVGADFRVLVAGGAGLPVAVLPGPGYPPYDPLQVLAATGNPAGADPPAAYPVAVSVAPGFVAGAAYEPGHRDAAAAVTALGALAAAEGCRAAAVLYLPAADQPELAGALAAAGYRSATVAAECFLDLPGDFDAYLAGLSRNRRTSVRREIRAFAAAGLTVTLDGPEALTARTAELHSAWRARHGRGVPVSHLLAQYARLREQLAAELRLLRVWQGGEQVAFAMFYAYGGVWYARAVGFDYDRLDRESFCYFTAAVYAPVRFALAEGAHRLELSMESYEAKLGRGCRLRPLSLALRTDEPGIAELLAAADARTRARHAELAG